MQSSKKNIDWGKVIWDLQKSGLSPNTIARQCNLSRQGICRIRDSGQSVMYETGQVLLALWTERNIPKLGAPSATESKS